jgi:hypothetical protein
VLEAAKAEAEPTKAEPTPTAAEVPADAVTISIWHQWSGDYLNAITATFDDQTWKTYTRRDSGFSGAEPLAVAVDAEGRRWIGTRTVEVDIYQANR